MGNLFTSILNTANAIRVYDRQLTTIQNNVANANTPGYVRQVQTLDAMRFDLRSGLPGGVSAGPTINARYAFAEQSVREQFARQSYAEQKASDLAHLEPLFDPSGASGIGGTLTKFFKSFSQLSVYPNDRVAREAVIEAAGSLAGAFNQTAAGIADAGREADQQIRDVVASINRIGSQLSGINAIYRSNLQSSVDAGLDAKMHAALEELSQFTDFTLIKSSDGTLAVYIGGQTPLLVGDHYYPLQADYSSAQTDVLDSAGNSLNGQIRDGKLSALLNEKNVLIPSYLTNLDTLAQTFADQVNAQLAAGVDASGAAPTKDLFQYDSAGGAAISVKITAIAPDEIAAALPASPGGNENALNVASLLDAKQANGFTFVEYFGWLGGRVGRDLATARDDASTRKALTTQARSFRQEVSGVSLDEEAVHLLQVQKAYQATGKLMSVLNEITDTLLQALR